jgi:hypothetical protein
MAEAFGLGKYVREQDPVQNPAIASPTMSFDEAKKKVASGPVSTIANAVGEAWKRGGVTAATMSPSPASDPTQGISPPVITPANMQPGAVTVPAPIQLQQPPGGLTALGGKYPGVEENVPIAGVTSSGAAGVNGQPYTPPAGWTLGGKIDPETGQPRTPMGEMPTISRVGTEEVNRNVTSEFGGDGSFKTKIPLIEARGVPELLPKLDPIQEASAKLDALVDSISKNPASQSRLPGGGLSRKATDTIAKIREAQLTGAYGLAGHKEVAKESNELRRLSIEQHATSNALAAEERKTARTEESKRKSLVDWDKRRIALGKTATGEHDDEKALFEAAHLKEPIPNEYAESAKRIYQPFTSVVEAYEKKTGKKLTPAELDEQKKNYIKNRRPNWSM